MNHALIDRRSLMMHRLIAERLRAVVTRSGDIPVAVKTKRGSAILNLTSHPRLSVPRLSRKCAPPGKLFSRRQECRRSLPRPSTRSLTPSA